MGVLDVKQFENQCIPLLLSCGTNVFVCVCAADGAAGGGCRSPRQQPAQLFPPGAAEPERPAATFHLGHHRLPVALHPGQALETDRLPLRTHRAHSRTA